MMELLYAPLIVKFPRMYHVPNPQHFKNEKTKKRFKVASHGGTFI